MNQSLLRPLLVASALFASTAAIAQSDPDTSGMRYRVGVGPQIVPKFPGSDDLRVSVLPYLSMAKPGEDFKFKAADQSPGIPLIHTDAFEAGPVLNLQGKRRRKDTVVAIDEVGFTVELGGYAQLWLTPAFRLRAEARRGVTGHRSWTGDIGADFVARDGDRWLVSIGPRVSLSDRKFQQTYFGISPAESARTGLAQYRPGGGVHSVGASGTVSRQLGPNLGVYAYAKYERLIDDAARSPFVRTYGSRNQPSGGIALTYTFNGPRLPFF